MLSEAAATCFALDAASHAQSTCVTLKKILITGATGFIGGRLAEVACERKLAVVGLVRTWSHAARLARLPVSMAYGDVLSCDSLRESMRCCDVVFHCAVDNRVTGRAHRRVSVDGTANVMRAALETRVKRVVHLSSTAVYGYEAGPESALEEGMYCYSGDSYCDGKIGGEKVALRYYREHGLPVTVLRPTIVYGPFGDYTIDIVRLIRQGRMVLVNGGLGVCNSLYVDNLVEAMLLSAERDSAVGEIFHISDAYPVTWREFIEGHARALGRSYLPIIEMTTREIVTARSYARRDHPSSLEQILGLLGDPRTRRAICSVPIVQRSIQVGKSMATVLPASTQQRLWQILLKNKTNGAPKRNGRTAARLPLSEAEVNMISAFENVGFSIEKAHRVIGYNPSIDFAEGMQRTRAWIEWARL
jgi:nucleoside-diphosphate-sugar epimerase